MTKAIIYIAISLQLMLAVVSMRMAVLINGENGSSASKASAIATKKSFESIAINMGTGPHGPLSTTKSTHQSNCTIPIKPQQFPSPVLTRSE